MENYFQIKFSIDTCLDKVYLPIFIDSNMRLYEETQQETTCLQYFLPQFVFSSERRVLSDKKIKRQKKINLSLAQNKILDNKPVQRDENTSLRTKAKQMNRLFKPQQNRVQSQKLTISSSLYKRTPKTNEQECDKPVDSAKVVRKNKTSCFKIVDSERISFEKCEKQDERIKQQYEKMPKKLTELRSLVIDNQMRKNNISRKINFAKSEKQDNKQVQCEDTGNETRRTTQRLTHKKPPNFFNNNFCQFTQTKQRPYLYLSTSQQPLFQHSWKQQTTKIISNHTKVSQSDNSLSYSVDHRTQPKRPIKELQIKKSNSPDQITAATIKQQKIQSEIDENKYEIIPLLDELRQSLERNEHNRALDVLEKYNVLKELSPIRNHDSQFENQNKSNRESETALKNKHVEESESNQHSSQQLKSEQASQTEVYRQSFPCQKSTKKIEEENIATKSVRKQPLKRLLEGVNTIVSKYDDDSARKSGSDAFSHVIFRLNGEGHREMMSEQNQSENQYRNTINFDYRLEGGQRNFQKRFGYSYKDAQFGKEKDIDSIKNRQSYNKFSKKITFSEQKPTIPSNPLSHEDRRGLQPINSFPTNKNYMYTVVDEVPREFSPKNKSVQSEEEIDWQKRIQEIYITNHLQDKHPDSQASSNPDIPSSFQESIVISRTISSPNSIALLKFEDRFKKLNYLGVGRYSSVYLFFDVKTRFVFAMKEIFKFLVESTQFASQLKQQIEIQKTLSHPNVIELYNAYEDQKKYYLMVEYGGDNLLQLLDRSGTITEKQCIQHVWDIANGLKYLHQNRIVHRDIKPENILLLNGVCKIADFGCAGYLPPSHQFFDETLGTPLYISPQIDKLEPYTFKTDCWSLGILAYQIRMGKLDISKQNSIDPCHLFTNQHKQTSNQYKQMIKQLLAVQESSRISIDELLKLPIFTI